MDPTRAILSSVNDQPVSILPIGGSPRQPLESTGKAAHQPGELYRPSFTCAQINESTNIDCMVLAIHDKLVGWKVLDLDAQCVHTHQRVTIHARQIASQEPFVCGRSYAMRCLRVVSQPHETMPAPANQALRIARPLACARRSADPRLTVLEFSCLNTQAASPLNFRGTVPRPYCQACLTLGKEADPLCLCPSPSNIPLTITELCAGIGCFSIAGCTIGMKPCFAMDKDLEAVSAFNDNFPCVCIQACITSKAWWHSVPPCRVITAGFPCQPYSGAGNQRGLADPRGGAIINGLLCFIDSFRPEAGVLENVDKFRLLFHGACMWHLVCALCKLGYHVSWTTRNVSSLKPQFRLRVIILFLRADIAKQPIIAPELPTFRSTVASQRVLFSTDELRSLPADYHQWAQIDGKTLALYENLPWAGYQRIVSDAMRLVPTIMASITKAHEYDCTGHGGPHGFYAISNGQPRWLHPRELARLQGIPESFRLADCYSSACAMIGNSVPPVLVLFELCIISQLLLPEQSLQPEATLAQLAAASMGPLLPRLSTPSEACAMAERLTDTAPANHHASAAPAALQQPGTGLAEHASGSHLTSTARPPEVLCPCIKPCATAAQPAAHSNPHALVVSLQSGLVSMLVPTTLVDLDAFLSGRRLCGRGTWCRTQMAPAGQLLATGRAARDPDLIHAFLFISALVSTAFHAPISWAPNHLERSLLRLVCAADTHGNSATVLQISTWLHRQKAALPVYVGMDLIRCGSPRPIRILSEHLASAA